MDALKALKDKLLKEKADLLGTDKKFNTKAELEAARLLKLRREEAEERQRKALKRKQQEGEVEEAAAQKIARQKPAEPDLLLPSLSHEEVVRRLRALRQPATLFGEDDVARLRRFLKCEKEVITEDENRGGQQGNEMLSLQKQDREKMRKKAADLATRQAQAAAEASAEASTRVTLTGSKLVVAGPAAPATEAPPEEDRTMVAFKKAAALLAERREEDKMGLEERAAKWIKKWMREWEADLEKRPEAAITSALGYQATMLFQQTQGYLKPLFQQLKQRRLHEELRAGLWMMVEAIRDRNYLYANDIYLKLAIGNAPWPIGVTSVGIHERSAREKISHVMNSSGQAHIMNDEATRKWLQAMKRLVGAVQRMYPTAPSRSVDFETTIDQGRGMAGGGSHKLALLQAEAEGETVEGLGLPAAPHFLEYDGKVMVPRKWAHILARAKEALPVAAEQGGQIYNRDDTSSPALGAS